MAEINRSDLFELLNRFKKNAISTDEEILMDKIMEAIDDEICNCLPCGCRDDEFGCQSYHGV